jgi:DNA-directed RNA polymerase specialized sigma24 family protein
VELPPPTPPELDATSVRGRAGIEAFVVSAYDLHHAEIFGFLARATRDPVLAEDMLEDTYRRLTEQARDGSASLEVRAWLYRVATSLVIGRSRGRSTAPSPETANHERAGEVELALAGLSAEARLALLLSGEGFSGEEIAAAIDRPVAATRALLCRARARVRVRRELFAEQGR